jgi:hypothetical protein
MSWTKLRTSLKVQEIYEGLRNLVDVVEPQHEPAYGVRELIIRDLNRF